LRQFGGLYFTSEAERVAAMGELLEDRVVRLIEGASGEDGSAAPELFPLVYEQLKDLARHLMAGERRDHTLQATDLVHEAYVRLLGGRDRSFAGRTHFFNAAAQAMRHVLVDHARSRGELKHGGKLHRLPLEALELARDERLSDLLAIDEAMDRLEAFSPSVAAVVRLRFYAGLDQQQTAAALGISERTVRREWTYGRAWLLRELGDGGGV
jgi:RNA polymerase sigma factor (TIGR02999 family)